jgi:hypothetical protein
LKDLSDFMKRENNSTMSNKYIHHSGYLCGPVVASKPAKEDFDPISEAEFKEFLLDDLTKEWQRHALWLPKYRWTGPPLKEWQELTEGKDFELQRQVLNDSNVWVEIDEDWYKRAKESHRRIVAIPLPEAEQGEKPGDLSEMTLSQLSYAIYGACSVTSEDYTERAKAYAAEIIKRFASREPREQLYRWVKASERLPEKDPKKTIHLRITDKYWDSGRPMAGKGIYNGHLFIEQSFGSLEIDEVEWLEPASPEDDQVKENERAALAWMRAQAKALDKDVDDTWGPLYLSRVIAEHITPASPDAGTKAVDLDKAFQSNADCYADTGEMGRVEMAMTKARFIRTVTALYSSSPTVEAREQDQAALWKEVLTTTVNGAIEAWGMEKSIELLKTKFVLTKK